jgi:hypothetical protein
VATQIQSALPDSVDKLLADAGGVVHRGIQGVFGFPRHVEHSVQLGLSPAGEFEGDVRVSAVLADVLNEKPVVGKLSGKAPGPATSRSTRV